MEKKEKMNFIKSKKLFLILSILRIMSFVGSMFALPNANAQTTRDNLTFPFIDAIPKPAGVGQPVLINFGLLNNLARAADGWNV